jgi:hypothetical protein
MPASPKAEDRPRRVGIAAIAAIGAALLAASALGTYQASLARGHAARDVVSERAPDAVQYLPGSTSQIGTIGEPLTLARRAALRAGFDAEDAPIDAFERLRSAGHDGEARTLLAQFWERKAVLADSPLLRVLYALQARVVDDDDSRRQTAVSAMAALGPLRRARHVGEGTILGSDAGTLVLQGSGWLHVANQETGASFDLESASGSALVDGNHLLTWSDGLARIWDLDASPRAARASFKLLPGEAPLSFSGASSGGCVVTSDGRVWRATDGAAPVNVARRRWFAGSIDETCDRILLRGDGIAAYRRRGGTWTAASTKIAGADPGGPHGARVEACAAQAPRCVLRDAAGVGSVWDFGSSHPRRLLMGIGCEAKRFSPDGKRLMCRGSQDGVTLYSESEAGAWTRTDVLLPAMSSTFLQDDGTICASAQWRSPGSTDRSDVLLLAPKPCWAPPAGERAWGSIRMLPTGSGAVFTYPGSGQSPSGYTELYGFDSRGESLEAASNAWFGPRADERLLEYDTTNSGGEKSYELAGMPFDAASALGDGEPVFSVRIDEAFFVESPQPSLIFELGYLSGSASAPGPPLQKVARWDLGGKHFCGPAIAGSITGVAPTGDAVVIDGRIDKVGACSSDRGFEPTDVTGVVAVGPGAARWIVRDGDSLQLQGAQGEEPIALPGERGGKTQIVFSPNGDQFLVSTARSLCNWVIRDDGTTDLDGCRWSTAGWASDAAWAATDKSGETVVVFDRTAEGAALRQFFGGREAEVPAERGGDVACDALPRPNDPPLAVLRQWEERLGHRFRDQPTTPQDAREMVSSEIVPSDAGR